MRVQRYMRILAIRLPAKIVGPCISLGGVQQEQNKKTVRS